jgi:hypothetical protein
MLEIQKLARESIYISMAMADSASAGSLFVLIRRYSPLRFVPSVDTAR